MSHSSMSCHYDSYLPSDSSLETDALNRHWNGRAPQVDAAAHRKSNLHHLTTGEVENSWDRSVHLDGKIKKHSRASSIQSKKALSRQSEYIDNERSWWYACCQKCHQEDSETPSWEPPYWQTICPYPLCPPYRKFAQTLAVFTIGLSVWLSIWIMLGDTAAPGGQLFMLAMLTIVANLGGWLLQKVTTLPALIGMLFIGILMKYIGFVDFNDDYLHVTSYIRKIALTIILTRAGLDLDPSVMKKLFCTVMKLGLIPWAFEVVLCAVLSVYLLHLPWVWGILLGAIIAAVSPAVIVPCLFRLRGKGYGVSKGIPTLVLAVSGIDDAASVAMFGIISSIIFSSSSMTMNILQAPLSIVGGIGFGTICGYLVKYVPEMTDPFLVPLRVLLLLAGGTISVLGSEDIGWGGAGPLAVITFAFVASKNWMEQGWEVEDNPVANAFEVFWMFFEPMLFSVTGARIVIKELDPSLVLIGGGILVTCMVLRVLVTSACAVRSNLNMKEKFFVGLAWMAKATVQAALGPIALNEVRNMADSPEKDELFGYAEIVMTLCIMSIVITAPLGAILITISGPRMLTKTTKPQILEGWRRSQRPSIRDISIIDEEELASGRPTSPGPQHTSSPSPIPPHNSSANHH